MNAEMRIRGEKISSLASKNDKLEAAQSELVAKNGDLGSRLEAARQSLEGKEEAVRELQLQLERLSSSRADQQKENGKGGIYHRNLSTRRRMLKMG
jgi:chromosome segregation ATPase